MIDTLYRERKSSLHGFDCRLKLILLPLLVIYYFLPLKMSESILLTGLLLMITLIFLGWKDLLNPLKMIFPLLILILILTPLFHRTGPVLFHIGGRLALTTDGIREAAGYALRLTGISLLFFLFFRTTPMEDLLLGLSWFRLPYTVTLVISIALRYIPHLAGLYTQIRSAHSLRCGINDPPQNSMIFSRFRTLFPALVSLMIQSVKTIPSLTMALELKGIGRGNPRSRLRSLPDVPFWKGQIFCSIVLLVLLMVPLLL